MVRFDTPEEKLNGWTGVDGGVPDVVDHADVVEGAVEKDSGGGKVDVAELARGDAVADHALNGGLAAHPADNGRVGGILRFRRRHVFHDGAVIFSLLVERVDDAAPHLGEPVGRGAAA